MVRTAQRLADAGFDEWKLIQMVGSEASIFDNKVDLGLDTGISSRILDQVIHEKGEKPCRCIVACFVCHVQNVSRHIGSDLAFYKSLLCIPHIPIGPLVSAMHIGHYFIHNIGYKPRLTRLRWGSVVICSCAGRLFLRWLCRHYALLLDVSRVSSPLRLHQDFHRPIRISLMLMVPQSSL